MKKQDSLKKILKIVIALFGLGLAIMHVLYPAAWPKFLSYLATIILPFLPEILGFFGIKASTRLQIAYLLFLGLAMVMGIDFDLYKNWYILGNPCFDKIVHTISGVFAAFVAKEALDSNYDGKNIKTAGSGAVVKRYNSGFAWLFIVSFVALSAAGWECFEFLYDQIAGGNMQELISSGLDDTMWDILSALTAGIITALFLKRK